MSSLDGPVSPAEQTDEPSGSCHICPQVLGPPAQRTIRRHECHPTGGLGSDRKEGVVTAACRMKDGDAVGHPRLDAATSSPFEDHDNGFGKPTRRHRSADPFDERLGCSRSVPPPAVRSRSDHVRGIDEEHGSSITVPAFSDGPVQVAVVRHRHCPAVEHPGGSLPTGQPATGAGSGYVLSVLSTGNPPAAVLLDAGGVFVLPDPERILGAFTRAECSVRREVLADAHYRAAARFGAHLDVEAQWVDAWLGYLQTYVHECGVPQDRRDEAHRHLDSEFADAGLWVEPVAGSREGLEALAATGVRLGIVSNADGMMGQRLAGLELCQVGPGIGVDIECVVDSGEVGVMKPDPRIFKAAVDLLGLDPGQVWYVGDMPAIDVVGARRAGIRPFLMDPLGLHLDAGYERVASLAALADLIATGLGGRSA